MTVPLSESSVGSTVLVLSDSFLGMILYTLAMANTTQSRETLRELARQGVRIPVWIQRDVLTERIGS